MHCMQISFSFLNLRDPSSLRVVGHPSLPPTVRECSATLPHLLRFSRLSSLGAAFDDSELEMLGVAREDLR